MSKSLSTLVLSLLLIWGWFFGITTAQYQNVYQQQPIQRIYSLSNPLQRVFSLLQYIKPLLQTSSQHASASEEIVLSIPRETLVRFLDESNSFDEFYRKLRISLISFLIENQYTHFVDQPYQEAWNAAIVEFSWDFKVLKAIETKDMLDTLLTNKLTLFKRDFTQIKKLNKHLEFSPITITAQEYQNLWPVFLFKTEQDLKELWYELISRKARTNTDVDYRIHNIFTAFKNIGNVRLIMPGETFSLARELHYNPNLQDGNEAYVDGLATFGNGARMVYAGWICGVATAFYQWTLTNLWLALVEYRAHSTYYRNLYEAEINGTMITDPWLDATLYYPMFDLKVQNIRDYPIITVLNFNGLSGSKESVLTLAKAQDRGSFEYLGSYKKWTSSCFVRNINWEKRTNCYRAVKNY